MRAQGSTEYLVLLAVALIVGLVVISLLGWFPGLGGGAQETQSESYWSGAMPFSIKAVKIAGTGNSRLTIQNKLSNTITLTRISFGITAVYTTSTQFTAGEERTITITQTCTAPGQRLEYNNVTLTYSKGGVTGIKQVGDKPLIVQCAV
jgi:hypothetical protein